MSSSRPFCKPDKDYLLVKQTKNRKMIHFTRSENVESILSKGILTIDMQEMSSMGNGVYAFPTVLQRKFSLDNAVGIVFESKDLEYYICIDSADTIAPIGYVIFKQNVPKENIVEVLQDDCIDSYYSNLKVDTDELMYLCGMDWTNKYVLHLVHSSKNLKIDLPKILKTLREINIYS